MPIPSPGSPGVTRRLLRDEAHDAIQNAILNGTIAPGEVLDDAALQSWLGLSRTPIRDALMILRMEGLVEIHAQSSTRVINPGPHETEDAIQAVGAVMGAIMRITIPSLSDKARKRLVALADDSLTSAAANDMKKYLAIGLKFYDALIEHCPNNALTRLARTSVLQLTFHYRATTDARLPNWDLINDGWARVKQGLIDGDDVAVIIAFEEMHRLPRPSRDWAPAVWADNLTARETASAPGTP